jgi:hypothetical protein
MGFKVRESQRITQQQTSYSPGPGARIAANIAKLPATVNYLFGFLRREARWRCRASSVQLRMRASMKKLSLAIATVLALLSIAGCAQYSGQGYGQYSGEGYGQYGKGKAPAPPVYTKG